ncbi:MAG: primosomal protein N' [Patescibacteria group bacterium]
MPRTLSSFDYRVPDTLRCQPGDIVFIPFRNRKVFGVIDEISQSPRKKTGAIKTITSVYPGISLQQQQLELIHEFARKFFVSPATVVNSILQTLPRRTFSQITPDRKPPASPGHDFQPALKNDCLLLYNTDQGKFDYIHSIVKTYLESNQGVLIVAPEISRVRDWERRLKQYQPIIFHRQLPPALYWTQYKDQARRPHGLTIGTRSALFTPLASVRLIIIDEEDNQNHRQAEMNPRYHTEDVARMIVRSTRATILMTSRAPRTTTMYQIENHSLDLIDVRMKLPTVTPVIIDLNEEKRLGNYTLISAKMRAYIFQALQKKQRVLLFHNKLGEARSFQCLDCHNPFPCPRCQKNLIIEKVSKSHQQLHCTLCGYTSDLPLACPVCHGVRLKQRGAGLQKIAAEISASFPSAKTHVITDAGSRSVPAKTDIIIGAQRALGSAILRSVQGIIVISADTILRLPDFSAPESTYRQLSFITQFAAEHGTNMMVQTSFPDHYAIRSAVTQNSDLFYQSEFQQRAEYHYPPATELVRLFIKGGKKQTISDQADRLYQQILEKHNLPSSIEIVQPGPSFIEKIRGQFSWQLIIKFHKKDWPTVKSLISLTTDDWLVDINPLNLLS